MSSMVRLQFRPSILIFVGESGRNIYQHLTSLCAVLPEDLHGGVGMLAVSERAPHAYAQTLPLLGADGDAATAREDARDEAGALAGLLAALLRRVQSDREIRAIQQRGYAVPVPQTQIFIAGHTTSPAFPEVLDAVAEELRRSRITTQICYVLSDVPHDAEALPSWQRHLLGSAAQMPEVNFSFLYEEMGQRGTFHSQAETEYAAAEALFALVATGIESAPVVHQTTQKTLTTTNVDQRLGSLGTSLIAFPRAAAERYCTDLLGAELMHGWTETLSGKTDEALRREQRERAERDGEAIYRHLSDREERPLAGGSLQPDLAVLRERHESQLRQLQQRTEELFSAFAYDSVADEYAGGATGESWVTLAARREGNAILAFHVWEQVARTAWIAAAEDIERGIGTVLNELWLREESGVRRALAYVERLDEGFDLLRERLATWRTGHRQEYEREIVELDRLSRGPWIPVDRTPTTIPTTADDPAAMRNPANAATIILPENAHLDAAALHTTPTHLPRREQEIVRRLALRADWLESQTPSIPNLAAAGAMGVAPVIVMALHALPPQFAAQPLVTVGVIALAAALAFLASWLVRRHALRLADDARDDVLRVYRRFYAYRCERREDELRVVLVGPLRRRVKRMRERLEHMQSFVESVQQALAADAEATRDQLFDGPSSLRDIYVANGERLTRDGTYTLTHFYAEVTRRRIANAREDESWHRSPEQMVQRLRQWLGSRYANVLDLAEGEFESAIRSFARGVIRTYLVDELVDIRSALAAPGERQRVLWQEAVSKSSVLFRPHTTPHPTVLVCGRDEHRAALDASLIHSDAVMVRTKHLEWLLVAQFCPGGALTKWSAGPAREPDVVTATASPDAVIATDPPAAAYYQPFDEPFDNAVPPLPFDQPFGSAVPPLPYDALDGADSADSAGDAVSRPVTRTTGGHGTTTRSRPARTSRRRPTSPPDAL